MSVADTLLRFEVKCFKVQAPINSLNKIRIRTSEYQESVLVLQ